jgi:hypothetical protein
MSDRKFKIGDKVRVDTDEGSDRMHGQIGTIMRYGMVATYYGADFPDFEKPWVGDYWIMCDYELVPVEEAA